GRPARAVRYADGARTRGDAPRGVRHGEQNNRVGARYQRYHREGPTRPSDAQNEGGIAGRVGQDGGKARSAAWYIAHRPFHAFRSTSIRVLYQRIMAPLPQLRYLRGVVQQDAKLVAIVDDDESIRSALLGLMKVVGLPARTFASAEEFLQSGDRRRTG